MISQKLKNIFVVSILVFIAHGLEEYFNEFYNTDSLFKFFFHYFNEMSIPQATFLLFQIMLWLAFIVFAFLIASEKWRLRLMILPGFIYIGELHHIWKALWSWNYYPGAITALVFPVIAVFYWKELVRNYKGRNY